jgi:Uma2 family endonuclease
VTIEEFEQLPDAVALHHELVNGELVDVSGSVGNHVRLRDYFMWKLYGHVYEHQLGYVLTEQEFSFGGDAHGPDISFIGTDKIRHFDGTLRVQRFVPDVAIEFASQSDPFESLLAKAKKYRSFGVREVWLISGKTREALVYSERPTVMLTELDTFKTELIPGLSIQLKELFNIA